ncbi:MAG: hypothetical protein HY870_15890 [Chloroflexi bacterium]|nr:hypothetical protein [Chloroflexota bacterium]
MEVHYFGWSGVALRHADTLIGFDLFGEAVTWAGLAAATTTILCVTHGHPEHCGSLRQLLSDRDARLDRTHVISSPAVIDHVTRGVQMPAGHLHPIEKANALALDGVRVTTFAWKHMPLLPPGLGGKINYAAHVLCRPLTLARIAAGGWRLPLSAPMLGFHVAFADGFTVSNYAEGLHRLTDRREVEAVAQRLRADVLLFAVEPEDVEVLPRWIEILSPSTVLLYEAHRPWREAFRLPYVDLDGYAAELARRFRAIQFGSLHTMGVRQVNR